MPIAHVLEDYASEGEKSRKVARGEDHQQAAKTKSSSALPGTGTPRMGTIDMISIANADMDCPWRGMAWFESVHILSALCTAECVQ